MTPSPATPGASVALHLHDTPVAGFDAPFEMLHACHQRVHRMLRLLYRLAAHLPEHGADAQAADAARDVMRYFDVAGPAHHEDEERHLFPLLRERGDAATQALVAQLQQEHGAMAARWATVRADLAAVAAGTLPADAGWRERWAAYAALYQVHIEAEEGRAYPAAPWLDAAAQAAMGAAMAARRGVR